MSEETCQVLTSSSSTGIGGNAGTLQRLGVVITTGSIYIGSQSDVSFWLQTPGGIDSVNISVAHYDGSGSLLATSNSINSDSVSNTSPEKHTFTFSPAVTISNGDRLVVVTSSFPLSSGNEVLVLGAEGITQEFTGNEYTKFNSNTSAWSLLTGSCQMCAIADVPPTSSGTRLPPPPLIARF